MDAFLQSLIDKPLDSVPACWTMLSESLSAGKLYVLDQMAQLIERQDNCPDYTLAREIYQWLTDNYDRKYAVELIRLDHILNNDPNLTDEEVETILSCEPEFRPRMISLLAKAVNVNNSILFLYGGQILNFIESVRGNIDDQLVAAFATIWDISMRMSDLLGHDMSQGLSLSSLANYHTQNDLVALISTLLDNAFRFQQHSMKCTFITSLIDVLSTLKVPYKVSFYQGLLALCEGNYVLAYAAFAGSIDLRCRLGLAYCLVHGFGTAANQEQAQAILQEYQSDGYACYLMAISFYKMNASANASKILSLLDRAYELGYKPAKATQLAWRYMSCMDTEEPMEGIAALTTELEHLATDESNQLAIGLLFHQALFQGDIEKEVFKRFSDVYGPLACLMRYFHRTYYQDERPDDDLYAALSNFNQSFAVRKRSLDKAIVDSLDRNLGVKFTELVHLYFNMSGDKDLVYRLAGLNTVMPDSDDLGIYKSLAQDYADTQLKKDDAVGKLLAAWLHAKQLVEHPDSSLVRQCLLETQGLEDDLLVTLRNSILRASGLLGELHLERPSLSYEMFSRKWIEQFFGYAFFDYNV